MIGDIFYLYIHPKDHRYNVFYTKKKNCSGVSHPHLHQGITLDPQLQSFFALPKTDAPIFFLSYPDMACHVSHVLQITT